MRLIITTLLASGMIFSSLGSAKTFKLSPSQTVTESEQVNILSKNLNALRNGETRQMKTLRNMATRSELDNTVIYEAPEGRVEHYSTSGSAYMAIAGMVGELPVENFDTEMVFCDNGEVYWKNCITQMVPNTYIKGIDKGDRIEFQFPQCIMSYPDAEGNSVDIYAHRMKYEIIDDETGEGWFYIDEDNDTVSLIKNEDGSLSGDVPKGEAILGMTTPEGEWYGYGNYDIVMTPGIEQAVEVPEGLETEPWAMISNGAGSFLRVGFDGDDVYFTEIFDFMPEAWVKGHIEGDKILIPNQFVGTVELLSCAGYFRAITMEEDEEYDDLMPVVHEEGITLAYDAEKRVMKSDYYFALMGGPGYLFEYMENPEIRWQPAEVEINLQDPVIVDCFDYDDFLNYGAVAFTLPALNKDGYLIDSNNIYMRMFVDGDPFEFDPEEYTDFDEMTEWVPFSLNGYDIHSEGSYHRFDFYFMGADTIGIQAKYVDGDIEYTTPIVTATTTSVKGIDADNILSVSYTDLSGVTVSRPEKGFYVKTVIMKDGSIHSYKVLVK